MDKQNKDGESLDEAQTGQSVAPELDTDMALGKGRRGSGALGGLALLLALAALALSGWLFWQDYQARGQSETAAGQRLAQLSERLDQDLTGLNQSLESAQSRFNDALSEQRESQRSLTQQTESQSQSLDDLQSALTGIEQRQAALEAQVAEFTGQGPSRSRTLYLEEAAWLMRLAEEQLALSGETGRAVQALTLAQDNLTAAEDPRLAGIRRTLAADIRALESHRVTDLAQLTGRIMALEDGVESWPLRTELLPTESQPIADTVGESGSEGFLDGVGEVLGKLVVVRRDQRSDTPVLAPDEVKWLKENTRRELSLARLAIQTGDQAVAEQAMSRVEDWAQQYFAADAPPVSDALRDLRAVAEALQIEPPPQPNARQELENLMAGGQ